MKFVWVTPSASVNKPWGEETCWNSQGEVIVKTIKVLKHIEDIVKNGS